MPTDQIEVKDARRSTWTRRSRTRSPTGSICVVARRQLELTQLAMRLDAESRPSRHVDLQRYLLGLRHRRHAARSRQRVCRSARPSASEPCLGDAFGGQNPALDVGRQRRLSDRPDGGQGQRSRARRSRSISSRLESAEFRSCRSSRRSATPRGRSSRATAACSRRSWRSPPASSSCDAEERKLEVGMSTQLRRASRSSKLLANAQIGGAERADRLQPRADRLRARAENPVDHSAIRTTSPRVGPRHPARLSAIVPACRS